MVVVEGCYKPAEPNSIKIFETINYILSSSSTNGIRHSSIWHFGLRISCYWPVRLSPLFSWPTKLRLSFWKAFPGALALCDREQSPRSEAQGLVILAGVAHHYLDPIHKGIPRLALTFQNGHASGDTTFACLAACGYISGSFYIESPLQQLARDAKTLSDQMDDLGQDSRATLSPYRSTKR
jgi:hypothetical protein